MPTSPPDRVRVDASRVAEPRWVQSPAELRAVRPADIYVQCATPETGLLEGVIVGDAVGWMRSSHRSAGRWLTAVGPGFGVAAVVRAARSARPDIAGATLPRAALIELAQPDALDGPNDWDWFVTAEAPPTQPHEDRVAWAGPELAEPLGELLEANSPRFSARPGDANVKRWCVLLGDVGEPIAAAAHVEHVPGVAHLASIVTRTDARGRGYGAAVTAWITRSLLADGYPVVTLGMYADNGTARRVYHRLGYRDTDHFASGLFRTSDPACSAVQHDHG